MTGRSGELTLRACPWILGTFTILETTPEIYEMTFGQDIYLAIFGDDDNYILMPFVRNDIQQLPFTRNLLSDISLYDIESLYGYGGPLAQNPR